jgi:hypothetical protein
MTPTRLNSAVPDDSPLFLAAATSSVVLTMAYFSSFRHPLCEEELLTYTHFYTLSTKEGQEAIRSLLQLGILESNGKMFYLPGDAALSEIRAEREARAAKWQPRVLRSIRVLSHLPFLRGLSISGSLSKGTQDLDGDIDFFVLTTPDRLWTARFFASLLLKVLPKSKKVNFCLNYFLPENRLFIPDRTLFSATEVTFLKPVLNGDLFRAFFEQNQWVKNFYPNWTPATGDVPHHRHTFLQRIAEWPLSGAFGNLVESWISRWFIRRLNRSLEALPQGQSTTEVRLGPKEYKGHTKGHQEKTRQQWQQRIDRLEVDLGIRLIRWPWSEAWARRNPESDSAQLPCPPDVRPVAVFPLKVTARRVLQSR